MNMSKAIQHAACDVVGTLSGLREKWRLAVIDEVSRNLKRISNEDLAECLRRFRSFLPDDFFEEVANRLNDNAPRGKPYRLKCLREDTLGGLLQMDDYKRAATQSIVLSMYESICSAIADGRMKIKGRRSKSLAARDRISKIFGKTHEWVRACCREARRADRFPLEDVGVWTEDDIKNVVEMFPCIDEVALRRLTLEELRGSSLKGI
ncbi:MAG: hypothetical protein WC956_01850 [bacterium]